jgi:hypothetical protein
MAYASAGIDGPKRMVAVVVVDLAAAREDAFERRQFGSTPAQLRLLADWLSEHPVNEVVMESTAQYWKPVWAALERHWTPRARAGAGPMAGTLHLAHARSNHARRPAVNEGSLRLRTTCGRRDERPRAQEQPPRHPGEERVVSYLTRRVHRTGGRHDGRVARTREKHASCGVCADSEVHGLLAV